MVEPKDTTHAAPAALDVQELWCLLDAVMHPVAIFGDIESDALGGRDADSRTHRTQIVRSLLALGYLAQPLVTDPARPDCGKPDPFVAAITPAGLAAARLLAPNHVLFHTPEQNRARWQVIAGGLCRAAAAKARRS